MTLTPDHPDPAALAAKYGLVQTTARPSLPEYLRRLWERRHFVRAYAAARARSQYSSSRLGQIWQVITPLMQAGVYYAIFGVLLGLDRGVANYPAFLITGVFVFTFMQRSLNNGAKSISGNLSLVRALHFPRAVLPLSFVLVEFKQLVISMIALFGIILLTGEPLTMKWLLVAFAMALQMLFNIGLSMIMARVGAGAQDVNQLLPFVTRVWFYTSGVFYSIDRWLSNLPGPAHPILQLNPGAIFLDLYRGILIDSHVNPPPGKESAALDLPWGLNIWAVAAAWSVVMLIGGFLFFWQREEKYGRG